MVPEVNRLSFLANRVSARDAAARPWVMAGAGYENTVGGKFSRTKFCMLFNKKAIIIQ